MSKIKLNANAKQQRLRSGESRILANRLLRSTGRRKKFSALITGEPVPACKRPLLPSASRRKQFPAATSPRIRALPEPGKAPPAEIFAPLRTTDDSQADVGRRRVFFGRKDVSTCGKVRDIYGRCLSFLCLPHDGGQCGHGDTPGLPLPCIAACFSGLLHVSHEVASLCSRAA